MLKKIFIFSLLVAIPSQLWPMAMPSVGLSLPTYYENIIAREYNRINGANTYSSINLILNQSLEGKNTLHRTQVINDLKTLKTAVEIALNDARNNGKRLWYWLYIFKDNEAVIDLLTVLKDKIDLKVYDYEWEMHWDITKAAWYTTKNMAIAALGIIALYASKNYIPQDKTIKDVNLSELLFAPIKAGYNVTKHGIKHTLDWAGYLAKKSGSFADSYKEWLSQVQHEKQENSPQS